MEEQSAQSGVVVRTLQDYVAIIHGLTEGLSGGALWFRGERNSAWSIAPGLYRKCYGDNAGAYERDIIALFMSHAPAYCGQAPTHWIDWMVMMQHHGCPTRLLDWTESALAALYFAVCKLGRDEDTADGTVYALDPGLLSQKHGIEPLHPGMIPVSEALRAERAANPPPAREFFRADSLCSSVLEWSGTSPEKSIHALAVRPCFAKPI